MTLNKKYDVIIAGGGTAGVSCAWNCAKRGLKTLIIEKNSFLGGSITSSLVVPAMKTADNAINTEFYDELYNNLKKINGSITYSDGNKGWFNPELTKIALDIMMENLNVDVLYESSIIDINQEKNKILSVCIGTINNDNKTLITSKELSVCIGTKYLVDATGDAKICQKLNCNFLKNSENIFQPSSLRFILSGVNFEKFTNWLIDFDNDRSVSTVALIDGEKHFSTAYTWDTDKHWALAPLFKKAIDNNELKSTDCNYFQIFSVPGTQDSVAFNAPRLLNSSYNNLNIYSEARQIILRLWNFSKKYLPGFENSHISAIANSLGIRLSYLVECDYIYKYNDLITGKKFKNPVLISNYPIDIHSDKKDKSVLKIVDQEYQLPLESLKVKGYDNLYVIGRCISAEHKAQAALRIIPSCFSMGEGLAKYLAKIINI